jgi:uncharacterized membrane protein
MKTETRLWALRLNFWALAFSKNWLRITLTAIGIFASLPFVAPTMMKLGMTTPASLLYTLYSPFCHQFAFRSIFLYGEQPFYPRAIANTPYTDYESYAQRTEGLEPASSPTDFSIAFWMPARSFVGNEEMGYKTTLCARDVAIYLALFMGGIIYSIPRVRQRLRPMPIWIYIIVGLGPIGLDGVSQLLSYEPFSLWQVRETMPFFRISTGALFGLMNAWLAFPYIEMSMREMRYELETKLKRMGYLS